jgi:transposase
MNNNRQITELIRMNRFSEIYDNFQKDKFSCEDAAMMLGCSVRHFLRLRERYDEGGLEGLRDGRIGKVSKKRAATVEVAKITKLYREKYAGFSVRHFHEFAKREDGITRGYTWTKTVLQKAGLVRKTDASGKHRLRRPRRPMAGMMIHQDASTHNWFGEENCDLVVTMDDATSEIYSAFFCEQEGTLSSLRGVFETIDKKGLFCSFYSDRGSHYWTTSEAGGKVDKVNLTQFGRALKQLKIEQIAAYSPQARGRSERMFATLQGRLPNELKLNNINDMVSANEYLRNVYLPRHNEKFMVAPEIEQSAFVAIIGLDIKNILCIQEDRVVSSDNTVHYQGKKLQLPPSDYRHHFVRANVCVHHYADGSFAVFHGPREIGKYGRNGALQTSTKEVQKIAA